MDSLGVERSGGVVTITFNRPEKKNALTGESWAHLWELTHEIAARTREDRCVVLTGAGGDFCSGQDLWAGPRDGEPPHQLTAMRTINASVQALHDLPQPTIAKVRGVAVGIGANLALGCDLVLAAEGSRFSEIFTKRGLSLDGGGSWILPRLVGLHQAKELAFFGDLIGAEDALAMGLVNRVLPDDQLDRVVGEWADRLVAAPPIALAMTKRMLNRSFEQSFEQALDDEARSQTVNLATADTAEAIRSFVDRTEARYHGR